MIRVAVAFLIFASPAVADTQSSYDHGLALCRGLDATGMTSKPCEVSSLRSSVNVSIDTTSTEAKKICDTIAAAQVNYGRKWDRGWTLRVYSPFSGDNSIAFCGLPSP